MLHRARHLFIRQQTAVINSIRVYLAEFGIVAPVGRRGVEQLMEIVADTADYRLPEVAGQSVIASRGAEVDIEDLTPEQQTFVGELAVRFAVVGGRLNYQHDDFTTSESREIEHLESEALTDFLDKTEPLWADLYGWRTN